MIFLPISLEGGQKDKCSPNKEVYSYLLKRIEQQHINNNNVNYMEAERTYLSIPCEIVHTGLGGVVEGLEYRVPQPRKVSHNGYQWYTIPVSPVGIIVIENNNQCYDAKKRIGNRGDGDRYGYVPVDTHDQEVVGKEQIEGCHVPAEEGHAGNQTAGYGHNDIP
jgi:hypothetical protein